MEPLAPAGMFVTVLWSWGSSGRERADGKSPFIEFELFPCCFFSLSHFYGKELDLT